MIDIWQSFVNSESRGDAFKQENIDSDPQSSLDVEAMQEPAASNFFFISL